MPHKTIVTKIAASCVFACVAIGSAQAVGAKTYHTITANDNNQIVKLNGKNLTVDKLIKIARHGAKVKLQKEARQRSLNAYYLLLEGARENIPIYYFNRGTGAGRQKQLFSGDPLRTNVSSDSPTCPENNKKCSNRDYLLQSQLKRFKNGMRNGVGPEVRDEAIVRAMMAVRVNTMSYEAATPQLTQMLVDLLNKQVTPVVQSRGSPGEGDLLPMQNVAATMVGKGQAYYHGKKMPASKALEHAGLKPLQKRPSQPEAPRAPFAADSAALVSTNAYTVGQAALLAHDAKKALNWQDLIYAMELNGMDSSITPIAEPVQNNRPFPWINGVSSRVMHMIKNSYLFKMNDKRIIQDPESLRAMPQRSGSAWKAWGALVNSLHIQLNSSDHNPAITPGYAPDSAPGLDSPWMKQYYVKGGENNKKCIGGGIGPATGCEHGYILSSSNWDFYPVNNEIEALTNAMANLAVNQDQVELRFWDKFFTVISADDSSLPSKKMKNSAPGATGHNLGTKGYAAGDLLAEIQTLQPPVPVQGNALLENVEDIEGEGHIKVKRARHMVDVFMRLLSENLLTAAKWMSIRHIQGQKLNQKRKFGSVPTNVWKEFREMVPWQSKNRSFIPPGNIAYRFLKTHSAAKFYPPAQKPPICENQKSEFCRR